MNNDVKRLRLEQHMTQVQLAEKSGVSRGTIINLERGNLASVQHSSLTKLADALDCTVEELFSGNNGKQQTEGKTVREMNLSEVKTCDLVCELERREGVEKRAAGPDEEIALLVSGPAIVLTVMD